MTDTKQSAPTQLRVWMAERGLDRNGMAALVDRTPATMGRWITTKAKRQTRPDWPARNVMKELCGIEQVEWDE